MKTTIITILVLIALLIGGWYAFNSFNVDTPEPQTNSEMFNIDNSTFTNEPNSNQGLNTEDDMIMCTADVMQCPDGSFVGRVPPSCSFAVCPTTSTPITTTPTPPINPPVFTPPSNK